MFLGCDISITGTGIVIIDDNYKLIKKERLYVDAKGTERLFHLENLFLEVLEPFFNKIIFTCMESPAFGVSDGHLFNIGEVTGIYKLCLFKNGMEWIYSAPTQVKKYCTGNWKAKKELMILKCFQNFGEEFDSSDLADAYILSRIASDYYQLTNSNDGVADVKKYQLEVLNKIKKTEDKKEESLLK